VGIIEDLLVNKRLNQAVRISMDDFDELEIYLSRENFGKTAIQCFCPYCGIKRKLIFVDREIFSIGGAFKVLSQYNEVSSLKNDKKKLLDYYCNHYHTLFFQCQKDKSHFIAFHLILTPTLICKVGQFPCFESMTQVSIEKYKPILGDLYYDFNTAIVLYGLNLGIPSIVYYQKVLEKIIMRQFIKYSEKLDVSIDDFAHKRFDDKLAVLEGYIPAPLIQNKNAFIIISKSIHELNENECKAQIPCLREGLELILDSLLAGEAITIKGRKIETLAKKSGR